MSPFLSGIHIDINYRRLQWMSRPPSFATPLADGKQKQEETAPESGEEDGPQHKNAI